MMAVVTINMRRGLIGKLDLQDGPHAKIVAPCPCSTKCTDSKGQHHSMIIWADTEDEIMTQVQLIRAKYWVTRVEFNADLVRIQ